MGIGASRLLCLVLAAAVGCADSSDDMADSAPTADAVPVCGATLAELLAAVAAQAPVAGGGGYQAAQVTERDGLARSLAAVQSAAPGALQGAAAAGYSLCEVAPGGLFVWTPVDASGGHASVAYRPVAQRQLIVEAPHPFFDLTTATEALAIFEAVGGRALIVAGTHRCANAGQPSGCDGTTAACGSSGSYPTSDMAHTTDSLFQAAHVAVAELHGGDWIVNLHGMSGAGVHISNGTTFATAADSPVALLAGALAAELPGETIASCNDYPGATTTSSLCGTTNVQGRAVNGAPAACTDAATRATGRFVHLEQSSAVRSQAQRVAAAIDAVAP